MVYGRILGVAVTFLVLLLVVGAGIVLVLETFGSEMQIAAGIVVGLLVLGVGVASGLGSRDREWISNPYW
jgi:hypothetical protein